jgi:hypothetical protein
MSKATTRNRLEHIEKTKRVQNETVRPRRGEAIQADIQKAFHGAYEDLFGEPESATAPELHYRRQLKFGDMFMSVMVLQSYGVPFDEQPLMDFLLDDSRSIQGGSSLLRAAAGEHAYLINEKIIVPPSVAKARAETKG